MNATPSPARRYLLAAAGLLVVFVAINYFSSPAPLVAEPAPAKVADHTPLSATPWFGQDPLPTETELKKLRVARDEAERVLEVAIATKSYVERFGAADDLVRTLMFQNPAINNPAFKEFLTRLKAEQVLHDATWTYDFPNSRDLLLPDPNAGPNGEQLTLVKLAAAHPVRQTPAPDTLDGIRLAALQDQNAQIAVQKVRDSFYALDEAVRTAMKKDPAVADLVEKYSFLVFGRKDLGYLATSISRP